MPSLPLPVDALLPDLKSALATSSCVVVEAAPGAGKTTRIPWFVAEDCLGDRAQVVVTEPRRIAARLAAHFVSEELGEEVGSRVGYSVRFEERVSKATRVRYVTEGVLLQQWLRDPQLANVQCLIIDEFHERHLATDQMLAACRHIQSKRPELKLIVMSATLDAEPLARFLGDCPRLRSEGKSYPLRVEHSEPDDRPLEKQVLSAIRRAFAEVPDGNVLAFLPGFAEIRKCEEALSQSPLREACEIVVLHGEQPIAEQAQAVRRGTRRRVILSTNVAESSVTVDGVRCVVDSGLARVASHSAWNGTNSLRLERVSQSSAVQRAGRAARQAPGVAYRLYTEADFQTRPAQQIPEIQRSELSELTLQCLGAGTAVSSLPWLSPPPVPALDQAAHLLKSLTALAPNGRLTDLGKRLLQLPLPVRLARVLIAGDALGIGDDTALAVSLLSERDIHNPKQSLADFPTNSSDVQDRIDRFREAESSRFAQHTLRQLSLDPGRIRDVRNVYERLRRVVGENDHAISLEKAEELVRRALLAGFSDRVARRKGHAGAELILSNGSSARLSEGSVVRTEPYVVVLDLEERSADGRRFGPQVRWASGISADWLMEDFSDQIELSETLTFSSERERVESISRIAFGSVTLDETRKAATPSSEASEVLFGYARERLATVFAGSATPEGLRRRVELLREYSKADVEIALLDDQALLRRACDDITTIAELSKVDFSLLLHAQLGDDLLRALRKECPEQLTLPGGRALRINYEPGKPPWIASRLQDFFGMKQTPSILNGRLPITVHLLAPNQRAVQVTSDLAGFWTRHYPDIRKELMRRYPRHAWPEDGATAQPSAPLPRR